MTATAKPREGLDRCACGSKYWDGITCHSCGELFDGEPSSDDDYICDCGRRIINDDHNEHECPPGPKLLDAYNAACRTLLEATAAVRTAENALRKAEATATSAAETHEIMVALMKEANP